MFICMQASISKYTDALADAEKVTEIKPDWPKGYSRLGAAYYGLKNFEKAIESYEQGTYMYRWHLYIIHAG